MKKTARFFVMAIFSAALFAAVAGAEDLRLDGINYDSADPSESLAIINGKLLKAGESVGGYEVTKVDRLEVRVKNLTTSQEAVLDMNKAASEVRSTPSTSAPLVASEKKESAPSLANLFGNHQKKTLAAPGAAAPAAKPDKGAARNAGMFSAIQDLLPGAGPLGAYRNFMNHVFRGEFEKARALVEPGSGAEASLKAREKKFGPCVAENQGKRFSSATYHLAEKKELAGGQVQLTVTQTASGDPPGATSAFGSVTVLYKHQASLVKRGDGWKVRSFQFSQTGGGEIEGVKMPAYWMCVD